METNSDPIHEETLRRGKEAQEIDKKIKEEKENEELDEIRKELGSSFEDIIRILKYYSDLKEENYLLIALWIIGSHMINSFNTYPYLFLNAPKGSGKTRLMRLIVTLSGGEVLLSPTEAILFRTKGALGIDEFESVGRKGFENIRELLNAAYKKGAIIKRMKKVKTFGGEEQQVESFSVYRPIVMANISGMDEVLGDRCFPLILDKSSNSLITKKIEIFDFTQEIQKLGSLGSSVVSKNIYTGIERAWNDYLETVYSLNGINSLTDITPLTDRQKAFFDKIDKSNINGRSLELSFPLLFVADFLNEKVFDGLLQYLKNMDEEKKSEDMAESFDVSLLDFICEQIDDNRWFPVGELTEGFRKFLNSNEEWINNRWMGKALKRSNLIIEKKKINGTKRVRLNIKKAEEKIKIFRPEVKE
jgi:hypothetical protein